MMHRKPSLGRGLADLLGARAAAAATPLPPVGEELTKLPLDLLQRGRYQPRIDMRPETLSELAEKLGARVAIQPGRGGRGKLVVSYNSLDELDGILAHIQ